MALDTADTLFNPRGRERIRVSMIVFFVPGHVAMRAHGVPVHATSGPVTPFSAVALFVAENVEPLLAGGIPCELGGLPAATFHWDEHLPRRFVSEYHVGVMLVTLAARGDFNDVWTAFGPARGEALLPIFEHGG